MNEALVIGEAKSTADAICARLHEQIRTLAILPGSKISKSEIARQVRLSQRLPIIDHREIRPQRARVLRRFVQAAVENTGFGRRTVEPQGLEHALLRHHVSRLNDMTVEIHQTHTDYFI